jgi:hypothetical protein
MTDSYHRVAGTRPDSLPGPVVDGVAVVKLSAATRITVTGS